MMLEEQHEELCSRLFKMVLYIMGKNTDWYHAVARVVHKGQDLEIQRVARVI